MNNPVPRFEDSSIGRLMGKYCLPAITAMVVQGLYNIVAGILLGQAIGGDALAAVQFAMPFQAVTIAIGTLVGIGSSALISIRLGQRSREGAQEVLGNALALALVISTWEIITQLVFLRPLLELSGASGEVLTMAWTYTAIIVGGSLFANLGFGFSHLIRAEGNPKASMRAILLSCALNLFLSWLFILVFRWGIIGAASAIVLSQLGLAVWTVSYFWFRSSLLKFYWKHFRLRWRTVRPILGIGLAPCMMQLAACVQAAVLNYQLSQYGGDDAVSVMSVVIRISYLVFTSMTGLSQGLQPLIGYNYGAQKWSRVRQFLVGGIVWATVLGVMGFVAIELFPTQIIRAFVGDASESVIQDGTRALRLCLLCMPLAGFQIVCISYYQAIGRPRMSIFLTFMRRLVFLTPMLILLPLWLGLEGIWFSYIIADALAALVIALILAWELGRLIGTREDEPISGKDSLVDLPEELY